MFGISKKRETEKVVTKEEEKGASDEILFDFEEDDKLPFGEEDFADEDFADEDFAAEPARKGLRQPLSQRTLLLGLLLLLALGGGVVGDLAGFVAATFLRGIPFVQIPTTLLAQVDSSVGGKTGVNHPLGKNLIGAFYQPRLVLIDVTTLATLSSRDYHAGFAEVVKYGVIRDQTFFSELVENAGKLCEHDPAALVTAIKKSCQIKADIVERDEREDGLRAILNYGHTFGHAIENLAGYGEYRHGEAVAIGMVVAAQISATLGLCTPREVEVIRQLLLDFKLPVIVPEYSAEKLLEAIGRDKKVHSGLLRMVLNRGIGDFEIRSIADPGALFSGLTSSFATE